MEFVSCSYLGLETHPDLIAAATEALRRFGLHFSTSRNRGRPPYLGELEELLSQMYGGAQVAAFTSVSNVHLGLLPLLGAGALPSYPVADAGVAFLVERTAHASIQVIRGVLEQIGPTRRFDMTDPAALPAAVREVAATGRTPIVLVDGVGSMGGLIDVASMLADYRAVRWPPVRRRRPRGLDRRPARRGVRVRSARRDASSPCRPRRLTVEGFRRRRRFRGRAEPGRHADSA